ncbi:MAG: hypothetical protein AB1567_12435 [bacterium]
MSEVAMDYWQLVQKKGDKLLVLLGKPKRHGVKKVVMGYLFVIIGLLTVAFILISTQIYVTSMGYTISQLQKQMHQLENLQRMLVVEVSSLRSAERIERVATSMGLIIPDEVEIIYLPKPQYLTKDNERVKIPFLTNFFKGKEAEAVVIE